MRLHPSAPRGLRPRGLRPHSLRAALVAFVAALLAAAGCGPLGDAGGSRDRAATTGKVAFVAHVDAAVGADAGPLRIQVATSYERTDNTLAPLTTQVFPATGGGTEQIPLSLDLTACLSDRGHRGADPAAGGNAVCLLHVTFTLLAGDRVLDSQTLGPVPLSPGSTANLGQAITLYEVARVEVVPSGGSAPPVGTPVRLVMGQSLPLTALVLDASGQVVSGRTVRWTSDAPAVARVDSVTGVVTPVAVGVARVHASVGGRDGTLDVNVVPAPTPITVAGGASAGSGHVRSSPTGLDCHVTAGVASGTCTFPFPGDTIVTLVATPDSGSAFGAWAGDCASAGTSATCRLTPSAARTASVTFTLLPVPLTVAPAAGNDGAGTVTTADGALSCTVNGGTATGACNTNVSVGTAVTLRATAADGQRFVGWGGACTAAGASPTCSLTVGTATAVTARFTSNLFALSVSGGGAGGGRLYTSTPGIDCRLSAGVASGTCAATFSPQTVTLTAAADSASVLTSWTGDCAALSPAVTTCPVSMTQARSVGVVFGRRQVTVTLTVSGAAGQVTLNGSPACTLTAGAGPVTCPVRVDAYGSVTLRAVPAPSSFTKLWGGPCATVPVNQPCTFRPSGDVTVPVTFLPAPVTISVRPAPGATGSGSVSIPALGQTCLLTGSSFGPAGQCDGAAAVGSTLTLTARAAAGSSFRGWGGACAGQTGTTCTLTVSAAATATADFELILSIGADVRGAAATGVLGAR